MVRRSEILEVRDYVMKRALLPLFVVIGLVGDATDHPTTAAITMSPVITSWLSNISTRAVVQTGDNVMIGGFIVEGTQPKTVIIRALGSELTPFGVADPLADPTLELRDGAGSLIASNDNWVR